MAIRAKSPCPKCGSRKQCQHRGQRPRDNRESGWKRYPDEYRANRQALLDRCSESTLCALCRRPLGADRTKWTADHIVPRSVREDHTLANLQPAHSRCNSSRGARRI
jgi:5-methylcytosine-specific restriction endonuclease McrA